MGPFQVVFGTAYMAGHTMYFALEAGRIITMTPSLREPQPHSGRGSAPKTEIVSSRIGRSSSTLGHPTSHSSVFKGQDNPGSVPN